MPTNLKLTFTDGKSVEFPFTPESMLTVETPNGVLGVKRGAWGEITDVELVDATDPAADPVPTPEPDPTPAVEPTPTPEPTPDTTTPTMDVAPVETPTDTPTTLTEPASPSDAIEQALTLDTTDDAVQHIAAALAKWPDDPDLLAAKADLTA